MKRRMINCSTDAVEVLYPKRDWSRIFKNRAHIRIPSDVPLDLDNYIHDQPESIWEIIDRDGIVVHPNESFLTDIQNTPSVIMDYPKDIFLVDQASKRNIAKTKSGVVVMPYKSAKPTTLKIKWEDRPAANKGFSWKQFFTSHGRDMSIIPNNALIITDLYLFDNLEQGIQNVSDILEEIMPEVLDSEYHLLIVTDISLNKTVTVDYAVKEIQKIANNIRRTYPLTLEVLFIARHQGKPSTPDESALFELYSASHNRRIYSNSFIITAEHGFNAVKENKYKKGKLQSRWEQIIRFECNYSSLDTKYQSINLQPVNIVDGYIEYLNKIVDNALCVGRYFINGVEDQPQNIVNRLIRY